jgi:dTDP-D-glucose 4,6-dehydratase
MVNMIYQSYWIYQEKYSLDDSKLRKLGWSPEKDFDIELDNMVTYYKNKFIW